ncbi:putative bifunctional diguanylate cyclase/phosphodiesterase [Salipaludibacillus daqingensis]|uniref:putative bifunctional diguanylate cyclase/phosphodiesterase n=1 Tax=Salipaludibacillus daqingensis TaxID=3041001 RepID=UPI0024751997|nr:EAL domain-containing protein [Salipaludibacillus daqingensis]
MLNTRQSAFKFLIVIVSVFLGWNVIFSGNDWMIALGGSVIPIVAGGVSFLWIFKAYQMYSSKHRYFWLLLSIGILIYLTANVIWFLQAVFFGGTSFPDVSYFLWLLAYVTFFIALIYKAYLVSGSVIVNPYIFNIAIFMIVASSLSIHYLIEPMITLTGSSLLLTITNTAFQIINLSILFVVTTLYYLSRKSNENKMMMFIIVGFSFQLMADMSLAYLTIVGSYDLGSFIDSFWIMWILVIGFAGLYAQTQADGAEPRWEIPDLFKNIDTVFPYASSLLLTVLVIHSYQSNLNALSIGLSVVFVIIVCRQYIVIKNNKELMNQYKHLAYHDPLTKLKNRTSFQRELDYTLEQAKRRESKVGLLVLDLDRFKIVNDTLGHHIGDHILKKASIRLKSTLGIQDEIYRLGGDEFVLIFPEGSKEKCRLVSEKIIKEFSVPFFIAHHQITITPSIGISLFPENGEHSGALLKSADAAMYLAKGSGRNEYRFYNVTLHEQMTRKMEIENGLRSALIDNQMTLCYQPKIELQSKDMYGMEALLRWEHPDLGNVSPGAFIPVAEETGQIVSIGEWVLKSACKQNKEWQLAGFPFLTVSVNVSVRQFQHGDFVKTVKETLLETDLEPKYLELEITESIMQNVEESFHILSDLRKLGVKIAIDDFGTGYSSLHILKELPIDTIKIDKAFIDDLSTSSNDSIVKTIINIAMNLNLFVVAEGIEHEHQVDTLLKYNCNYGQGYLFQRPVDVANFERFMKRKRLLVSQ